MKRITPLLQAIVYGDSAYPSGRYTLSHGLEGLVQLRQVAGAEQNGEALLDHLRHTATPGDGVATAFTVMLAERVAAERGAAAGAAAGRQLTRAQALETLIALDHELSATKITEALRKASTRVGRQTLMVHGDVAPMEGLLKDYAEATAARRAPGNQAIALGLIHHAHGLGAQEAVGVELIGLAVGWSSAALRLRQCDHISGQAMVAKAIPLIEELATEATDTAQEILGDGALEGIDLTQIGRASPGLDLASAEHQFAPARLFMS